MSIKLIGAALIAAGNALLGTESSAPAESGGGESTDKPRRGRPPKEDAAKGGKTLEEMRAIIEPLVKGGQGNDVKACVKKYTEDKANGVLKDVDPKDYEALAKDLEALSI